MKFEDLKELGSESAVKVVLLLSSQAISLGVIFLAFPANSFSIMGQSDELVLLHRLPGSIGRRGKHMLSRMETLFSSNSTSLVVGRSEVFYPHPFFNTSSSG